MKQNLIDMLIVGMLAVLIVVLSLHGGSRSVGQAMPADATPYTSGPAEGGERLVPVDVVIDAKEKNLAAYQVEVTVTRGKADLAGVGGGEHAAFKEPPYYDPAALHGKDGKNGKDGSRIILAAFNTGQNLPAGRTRVARLNLFISGNEAPAYATKLAVAAAADGKPIDGATVSLEEAKEE